MERLDDYLERQPSNKRASNEGYRRVNQQGYRFGIQERIREGRSMGGMHD